MTIAAAIDEILDPNVKDQFEPTVALRSMTLGIVRSLAKHRTDPELEAVASAALSSIRTVLEGRVPPAFHPSEETLARIGRELKDSATSGPRCRSLLVEISRRAEVGVWALRSLRGLGPSEELARRDTLVKLDARLTAAGAD